MATDEAVTLYGAAWSVYVRIVRLALAEKQVKYGLVEVDVFADTGVPHERLTRHPFGRIPTFEHGDFHRYETGAIVRYIDDAFPRCMLQPTDPKARAKVNQIIRILDAYAYQTLVWGIYVERVVSAREGRLANGQKIAAASPRAAVCLSELARLIAHPSLIIDAFVFVVIKDVLPFVLIYLFSQKTNGWFTPTDERLADYANAA
ncbi:glutathione S-transferase family protein [Paraburkholderia ginsengiterrae]|uniref:glutathione S-transferase family protein n=1 Tax=Paraburkholderia ginsengiterrae TaxID=1462993 RepID=UPI000ADEDEE2|nr:glutathione S-transferase family protein [Paraburkholderia ginsengiterrae]